MVVSGVPHARSFPSSDFIELISLFSRLFGFSLVVFGFLDLGMYVGGSLFWLFLGLVVNPLVCWFWVSLYWVVLFCFSVRRLDVFPI